jgi:hypothetical protein
METPKVDQTGFGGRKKRGRGTFCPRENENIFVSLVGTVNDRSLFVMNGFDQDKVIVIQLKGHVESWGKEDWGGSEIYLKRREDSDLPIWRCN